MYDLNPTISVHIHLLIPQICAYTNATTVSFEKRGDEVRGRQSAKLEFFACLLWMALMVSHHCVCHFLVIHWFE